MLKMTGLILIMTAGAGLGFCSSFALTRRERAMGMLLRMVIYLKGEIRYGNASLHDAFGGAARKLPGEYAAFMKAVAGEMRNNTGQPFGEIFRNCAVQYLDGIGLTEEEREKFFSLGEHLGYLDLDMQMKQLELYEQELERSIQELKTEMPAKKKVYQSLGILGGILLAVLVW
ncbi:MAG: stage III sporulation protein AB [Eubacteriales bacterium]|nr:stage III sporulation protein AB [Eubacteriales bacterium]